MSSVVRSFGAVVVALRFANSQVVANIDANGMVDVAVDAEQIQYAKHVPDHVYRGLKDMSVMRKQHPGKAQPDHQELVEEDKQLEELLYGSKDSDSRARLLMRRQSESPQETWEIAGDGHVDARSIDNGVYGLSADGDGTAPSRGASNMYSGIAADGSHVYSRAPAADGSVVYPGGSAAEEAPAAEAAAAANAAIAAEAPAQVAAAAAAEVVATAATAAAVAAAPAADASVGSTAAEAHLDVQKALRAASPLPSPSSPPLAVEGVDASSGVPGSSSKADGSSSTGSYQNTGNDDSSAAAEKPGDKVQLAYLAGSQKLLEEVANSGLGPSQVQSVAPSSLLETAKAMPTPKHKVRDEKAKSTAKAASVIAIESSRSRVAVSRRHRIWQATLALKKNAAKAAANSKIAASKRKQKAAQVAREAAENARAKKEAAKWRRTAKAKAAAARTKTAKTKAKVQRTAPKKIRKPKRVR